MRAPVKKQNASTVHRERQWREDVRYVTIVRNSVATVCRSMHFDVIAAFSRGTVARQPADASGDFYGALSGSTLTGQKTSCRGAGRRSATSAWFRRVSSLSVPALFAPRTKSLRNTIDCARLSTSPRNFVAPTRMCEMFF